MTIARRAWVPEKSETLVQSIAARTAAASSSEVLDQIEALAARNRDIHERECFNLNPAANVMSPKAEALLSSRLGARPSLGYPGDKYETGLEAIEEIEVIAAELAAEVFGAKYAEIRVPSGAMANLYGFMATTRPGDAVIVPPAAIGGHVTHHEAGNAGRYGLRIFTAPVARDGYTVDLDGVRALAEAERPRLITIGGSLNLFPHPVAELREIADSVGAWLMFDAAHQCGLFAGGVWTNPLEMGAHLMTMSTYKSLGGPAGGLIVSNEAEIAERLDSIAFPSMTANFDAAKSAALAVTMTDWRDFGKTYAEEMVMLSVALAESLAGRGVPVFATGEGFTSSHQFAVKAAHYGGGQNVSKKLRKAGFLASGIGLPIEEVAGDMNGLRLGTPEIVRWGMTRSNADQLAELVADALGRADPEALLPEVSAWRRQFDEVHFVH